MRKLNPWRFKMEMKYGQNFDAPLFRPEASSASKELEYPPQAPLYVDDATEEKAEVYTDLNRDRAAMLDEQRERVLSVIKEFGKATDNQVARVLKIHPSTIAARRNELRDRGLVVPVLDEHGIKVKQRDPITGIPNTLWRTI